MATKDLILKDGTIIELIEASYPDHYVMSCRQAGDFQQAWNAMTDENIYEMEVREDGEVLAFIRGSWLTGTQTVHFPDGTILGHFYMAGGEEYDPEDETEEPDEGLPVE